MCLQSNEEEKGLKGCDFVGLHLEWKWEKIVSLMGLTFSHISSHRDLLNLVNTDASQTIYHHSAKKIINWTRQRSDRGCYIPLRHIWPGRRVADLGARNVKSLMQSKSRLTCFFWLIFVSHICIGSHRPHEVTKHPGNFRRPSFGVRTVPHQKASSFGSGRTIILAKYFAVCIDASCNTQQPSRTMVHQH